MKNCELCESPAQTYCESDRAILCWDCDAKVHGANFLVARHSRSLLCNDCKSPTPWKASGVRLGRTVSVCDGCASAATERCEEEESEGENDDDIDSDADNDEEEEEVEEGENQVVPWTSTPPPPAASSSGSDGDFSETVTTFSRKRTRENIPDLNFPDHVNRSRSTERAEDVAEGTFSSPLRPLKSRRAAERSDAPSEERRE